MVFQNDILAGASGVASTYQIDQSIRFDSNGPAYLSHTFSTPTDGKTFTWSGWVKRGKINGTSQTLISGGGGAEGTLYFHNEALEMYGWTGGAYSFQVWTSPLLRDPSAWYHVVVIYDSTESTAADRVRFYVNGERITSFQVSSYPSLNSTTYLNSAVAHRIGYRMDNLVPWDGYMAEINFIDGQALDPTDFGETNDDGVWIPKAYAGTYGTNGFYITGEDSADLGADYSGNSNDFTSSGLTSDDQRADTPTNNLMTFNPLNNMQDDGDPTDGNRVFKNTGSTRNLCGTTFHFTTGKYVQAFSASAITGNIWNIGTMPSDEADVNDAPGSNEDLNAGVRIFPLTTYYIGGTGATTDTGITADTNDTYWVAMDLDAGKQWVGIYDDSDSTMKWFDSSAGTTGDPAAGSNPTSTVTANDSFNFAVCGRSSVELTLLQESEATGTVPTGFTYVGALQDTYAAPAVTDGSANFQTTLYTGNGTAIGSGGLAVSQSENSTFQPDFVWIKRRNAAVEHALTDAVRGVTKELSSNDTGAEETVAEGLTTFGSSGFTVGSDASYNTNTGTYAAWQWLAANGTATNEDGSITSTVSANTTAGFSIVSYTGNATGGATIGHGLSQAPEMVITKSRDNGTGRNWAVYHVVPGPTKYGELDNTNIFNTGSTRWNNTAPSSTVVTLGSQQTTNDSGSAMIAYCWHSVEGFSKFGSFTGNSSLDGPFVYLGFTPAFVMVKRTDVASDWFMMDDQRPGYNVIGGGGIGQLPANLTYAESSLSTYAIVDFLSNGFKTRADMTYGYWNASGGTYIYMAFAEHPFGGDGVAPATAR